MNIGFKRFGSVFRELGLGVGVYLANKLVMFLGANGNVGIGTTLPGAKLDVNAGGTTDMLFGFPAVAPTYNLVSLNGSNAEGIYIGITGGGGTDTGLYIQSGNAGNIHFRTGNGSAFSEVATLTSAGNFSLPGLGTSFRVKEGSNACMGTAILVNGTVTVSTTAVTANSRIMITVQNTVNSGFLVTTNRVNGTSFDILSSSGTDGSTVAWIIFEPA